MEYIEDKSMYKDNKTGKKIDPKKAFKNLGNGAKKIASNAWDTIKAKLQRLIQMLKECIQRIISFTNEKLVKVFKMDTIKIKQNYYNRIMKLIKDVDKLNPSVIQTIKLNATFLTANTDYVKKVYNELEYAWADLQDIAAHVKDITYDDNDTLITIQTSSLKRMENRFKVMKDNANTLMFGLAYILQQLSEKTNEPVQKFSSHVMVLGKLASFSVLKSNTMLMLVGKLFKNAYDRDREDRKKYEDIKKNAVNGKYREAKEAYQQYLEAQESLRGVYAEKRNATKEFKSFDEEISNMPEKSKADIKAKIVKINQVLDIIGDHKDKLKDMKADSADKIIGVFAKLASISISTGAAIVAINDNLLSNYKMISSKEKIKRVIFLYGIKFLNDVTFKKACLSDKKKAKSMLLTELNRQEKKYKALLAGLQASL